VTGRPLDEGGARQRNAMRQVNIGYEGERPDAARDGPGARRHAQLGGTPTERGCWGCILRTHRIDESRAFEASPGRVSRVGGATEGLVSIELFDGTVRGRSSSGRKANQGTSECVRASRV